MGRQEDWSPEPGKIQFNEQRLVYEKFCLWFGPTELFLFFDRMRERGPCICGVGVWSLLLSLCLASLTQAHRSHTGEKMCVCVFYSISCVCVCVFTTHSSWWTYHRLPLQAASTANFVSHIVKLVGLVGGGLVSYTTGNTEASKIWKRTGSLAGRTHKKKFFTRRNWNKSNPTKQGLLRAETFKSSLSHQCLGNVCTSPRRRRAVSLIWQND